MPREEYLASGHRACQGCAEALAVRIILKGHRPGYHHGPWPTRRMEIISSPLPTTSWNIPWIHVAFRERGRGGLRGRSRARTIGPASRSSPRSRRCCMAGDGGTNDIGLQALSGAMERGHDFTYICFDNEAYMNTGIQRSTATPFGAHHHPPPGQGSIGQFSWKKAMAAIAVAHDIPYVATAIPQLPLRPVHQGEAGLEAPGPARPLRAFGLPHRMAERHGPDGAPGPAGDRNRGLSPV